MTKRNLIVFLFCVFGLLVNVGWSQTQSPLPATIVASCGTAGTAATTGRTYLTIDTSGHLCTNASGGGGGTGTDTTGTPAALNGANAVATVALAGQHSVMVSFAAGTLVGTVTPQVSLNGGTTYTTISPASGFFGFFNPTDGSVAATLSNPSAVSYGISIPTGATNIQVKVTAYTSGTVTTTLRAVAADTNVLTSAIAPSFGTLPPNMVVIGGLYNQASATPLNEDSSGDVFTSPANFVPENDNLLNIGGTAVVTGGVNGSLGVGGLAASGSTVAGNPVLTAGASGTTVQKFVMENGTPVGTDYGLVVRNIPSGTQAVTVPLITYNSTQPTLSNGQTSDFQISSRAGLIVATGADTFNVTVNAALATGANTIGKVDLLGNTGAVMDAAGQNVASPANELLTGCQFNTSPTTITSTNMSPVQCDNKGNTLVNLNTAIPTGANVIGAVTESGTWTMQPGNTANTTPWLFKIMDAAGNSRGANVDANNNLNVIPPLMTYNSTQPTLSNGQTSDFQITSRAGLIVATGADIFAAATMDTSNTTVKPGDVSNNAVRVNVVAGGATGSTFGATFPTAGSASGFHDVNGNMNYANVTPGGGLHVYLDNPYTLASPGTPLATLTANRVTRLPVPIPVIENTPLPSYDLCGGSVRKGNVAVSQAGTTKILGGQPGQLIFVCYSRLVPQASETIAFWEGTGSNCGTNTLAVTGSTTVANSETYVASGGFSGGEGIGTIFQTSVAGNDLCIAQAGSVRVAGNVAYAFGKY